MLINQQSSLNLAEKINFIDKTFIAPELVEANSVSGATPEADVYSVGAIIYLLASKGFP